MSPFDFKVYAIDFDGTLCFSKWPRLGPPNKPLIDIMKEKQAQGDKIILWTCRTGEMLDEAVDWCTEQGLIFDAVNTNIPEIIKLYGEDGRKVSADYYIDDKNMEVTMNNNKIGDFIKREDGSYEAYLLSVNDCKEAADAIEQLVKERDAAISDLRRTNPCVVCKHFSEGNCGCDAFYECAFEEGDLWEWRGVQNEMD